MTKIGINGFGRIGRCFLRQALREKKFDVAVVNDLASIEMLAHLFKYDSVHGVLPVKFECKDNQLIFENGQIILFTQYRDAKEIPWKDHNVELVVECTGLYLTKEKASVHLEAGAKKVILSAPAKDQEIQTVVLGVNEDSIDFSQPVISNASCTTNSIAPVLKVLMKHLEISTAFISTIHSFTSDQRIHDAPHTDFRRARAASNSIIPTSTGAANAIVKIFPELKGKIDGGAVRVPVIDGSMTELTIVTNNTVSIAQINEAIEKSSEQEMKGIIAYTEDPIVSVDVIGHPASSIFDAGQTKVINNLVKVVAWYDNEMGYSTRLVDLVTKLTS
jgi:glyceraldehyde 3-phosphate dehydrogenase